MPHKPTAPELQLKVVQRNYESISKLMHCKQQECDKVPFDDIRIFDRSCSQATVVPCFLQLSLELEGARAQLQDATGMHQQAVTRASNAEAQIKVDLLQCSTVSTETHC